jgi:predicted dehydrogenase
MNRQVKVALIGFGWWGKNLAKAIEGCSQINLEMIVSKELEDTQAYAQVHQIKVSDKFVEALSNPTIEAIILATPHSLHAEQIIAAANAGKHIFCEKPLALTHHDAKMAITACAKNNVVLGVGQNKRFWPSMQKLREVVATGALGNMMHIEGHYSNEHSTKFFSEWRDKPTESPAGGLTGTGIHIIDALVNLAGNASEVSAHVASFRSGKDPRDASSVNVRFDNGISAYFAMIRATPFFWRIHVFGDAGSVEAIGETECVLRLSGGRLERYTFPAIDSIKYELEAFATAVSTKNGTPYPISTAEMSQTIALFEAIVQSVTEQSTVKVSK